ncbi:MAG: GDP-L-fucose synthase [Alphaproteobacteria bacterium]
MQHDARIFVAGHRGLVGSSIVRELKRQGYGNLILAGRETLDLTNQMAVDRFFLSERPEYVFLCAAKVGGIVANDTYPADFIAQNLKIQANVIDSAWKHGTKRFQFAGSGCIYPRDCPQPIKEDYLLTGPLEKTNEWYAIAKIAGLKMCEAYRKQHGFDAFSVMPANVYGEGDQYDLNICHVVPALLRKCYEAQLAGLAEVVIWGTGTAKREILHVDDLAAAMVLLMQKPTSNDIINIGSGEEYTITDLAHIIAKVTGFKGSFVYDRSKPDGTPRKLLDSSRIRTTGWKPRLSLEEGLRRTLEAFCAASASGHSQARAS